MNEYKRRYWKISEDTTKNILKIYNENKEDLKSKRRVYGEIIEIAIDNLLKDMKNDNETLGDIINRLY